VIPSVGRCNAPPRRPLIGMVNVPGGPELRLQFGRVHSDLEWRRIKPFRGTDSPRKRFLSVIECNKLLGASPPAFRNLAQAALLTGLRPGELRRLDVSMVQGARIAVGQARRPRVGMCR